MSIYPYRDKWVVAKEFCFRGVELAVGSSFRIRTLHPRTWKKLISDGSLAKEVDFLAQATIEVEVAEEVKVPEVEVAEEVKVPEKVIKVKPAPKKSNKKKSTKKKAS